MRRFLRIRLFLVLFAFVLAPAAVLPFAESLRNEWAKFWDPEPEPIDPVWAAFASNPPVLTNAMFLCPTDWSNAAAIGQQPADQPLPILVEPLRPIDHEADAAP